MSDADLDPQAGSSENAANAENIPKDAAQPTPDARGFFERLRDVVGEERFKDFEYATFRKQRSRVRLCGDQGTRILVSGGLVSGEFESMDWLKSGVLRESTSTVKGRPERAVIIVEDIGHRWIEKLDAAFGIDPLFVLAYARGIKDGPQRMETKLRERSHPLMVNGNSFSDNIKGHWAMFQWSTLIEHSDWRELKVTRATNPWWFYRALTDEWRHRCEIMLTLGCCQLDENTCKHD